MESKKRILNEASWQEDRHWICPHCNCKNETSTWMNEEECEECKEVQFFETDYVDAYEGVISRTYLGPK